MRAPRSPDRISDDGRRHFSSARQQPSREGTRQIGVSERGIASQPAAGGSGADGSGADGSGAGSRDALRTATAMARQPPANASPRPIASNGSPMLNGMLDREVIDDSSFTCGKLAA